MRYWHLSRQFKYMIFHIFTFIIWPAPRAGNMNQIARCDWLPERARQSHLARWELPAVSRKKNFPESHIINHLLTKFVRSRWLDIGLVLFFCEFMELNFVSVHKHAKKEIGQYPAILTSPAHTWSITHIYILRHLKVYYELTKWPPPSWLDNSAGRALHRYSRAYGFESLSSPNFFSGLISQLLKVIPQ